MTLTVLHAGAGFGKSTLLDQAVRDNEGHPEGDDIVHVCGPDDVHVTELAAALRARLGLGARATDDPVVEARAIVNAMAFRSPQRVCLILDDAHAMVGHPSEQLVTNILDRLPANGHLVVATRTMPRLPVARLVAKGMANVFDHTDLAFTPDEARAFAQLRGRVEEQADGEGAPVTWPALAELAVGGAKQRGFIKSYLVEEVLPMLSDAQRDLLGRLLVIDGADDELAGDISGRPVQLSTELADVPLVSPTEDGRWRPHALWHEVASALLSDREQDDVRSRAGRRLAMRGRYSAAFRVFATARDWDAACDAIVQSLAIQPPAVGVDVLQSWREAVPIAERRRPAWRLLDALITYESSLTAARPLLDAVAYELAACGDVAGEVSALFHLATIARRQNDLQLLGDVAARLAPLAERGDIRAIATFASATGLVHQVHGRTAAGLEALDAVPINALARDPAAHVLMMRANLHLLAGRAEQAFALYAQAGTLGSPSVRLLADELCATARWAEGDLDEALERQARAADDAGRAGLAGREQQFRAALAAYAAMVGASSQAEQELARVEQLGPIGDIETEAFVVVARASLALADGDGEHAEAVVRAMPPPTARLQRAMFLPAGICVALGAHADEWLAVEAEGVELGARIAAQLGDEGTTSFGGPMPTISLIRSRLPWPLATRLALLLIADDRPEGDELLEAIGPVAKIELERLSETGRLAPIARRLLGRARLDGGLGGTSSDTAATFAPSLRPSVAIAVRLFGSAAVLHDDEIVAANAWRRGRVRELLASLVLHPTRTREVVAEQLWPDQAPGVANRNLRVTLTYLLEVLEPGRAPRSPSTTLVLQSNLLGVRRDAFASIDVAVFNTALDAARDAEELGDAEVALRELRHAVSCWTGELAPDLVAVEWLEPFRAAYRGRFVVACVRAGDLSFACGDAAETLRLAELALVHDPWSERAGRLVAVARAGLGDSAGARAAIRKCLADLEELGAAPEADTLSIAKRLGVRTGATTHR